MSVTPIYSTRADLARAFGVDPRNKALDTIEPVARVKLSGEKLVNLYDREAIIAGMVETMKAAVKRFAREDAAAAKK
jgi:hypothetical protein